MLASRYWAGNPSVEIIHGHIKVSKTPVEEAGRSGSGGEWWKGWWMLDELFFLRKEGRGRH